MLSFKIWLQEDAGETVGTYQNDELLQSAGINSKRLAKVAPKELSPNNAECNFLGRCEKKRHGYRVNKDIPEEV
jgi:hypothetical protein